MAKEEKYEYVPLQDQITFPLYLCSKEVIRMYSLELGKHDLTYTQYLVMQYFWEQKTSNVKEIGKTMLLDSSTLTPLLKKLESKGLITRKKSNLDERNLVLELTKKGANLKNEIIPIPHEMRKNSKINEKEEKELKKLLMKILNGIEEDIRNENSK